MSMLFIRSPTDGHWGCSDFGLGWIGLLWTFDFAWTYVFSVLIGTCTEVELLACVVTLCLTFENLPDCFPNWLHHFPLPKAPLPPGPSIQAAKPFFSLRLPGEDDGGWKKKPRSVPDFHPPSGEQWSLAGETNRIRERTSPHCTRPHPLLSPFRAGQKTGIWREKTRTQLLGPRRRFVGWAAGFP